jgi:hypothetical protein
MRRKRPIVLFAVYVQLVHFARIPWGVALVVGAINVLALKEAGRYIAGDDLSRRWPNCLRRHQKRRAAFADVTTPLG